VIIIIGSTIDAKRCNWQIIPIIKLEINQYADFFFVINLFIKIKSSITKKGTGFGFHDQEYKIEIYNIEKIKDAINPTFLLNISLQKRYIRNIVAVERIIIKIDPAIGLKLNKKYAGEIR